MDRAEGTTRPQAGVSQGLDTGSLTVVILTLDEAHHIERAIASIRDLASRIVVVDSGSTDGTREIAASLGAEVFERQWLNYADQFQWALGNCAIDTAWTMRLDADEWLDATLVEDLKVQLASLPDDVSGISLGLRYHVMGKWIRFGGRYPLRLLRIWRTGAAHIEPRWMDEHMVLDRGRMVHVAGKFVDENRGSLAYFTAKHNAYATREAVDALMQHLGLAVDRPQPAQSGTPQAHAKRSIKLGFYNRLPLGVGPLLYFLYRYVLRLGFLDGRAGLIYHVLQGFWYRFLVDARKYELVRGLRDCRTDEERVARLSEMTGLDLARFAANACRD